jgi:hypothetical protein
MRLKFRLGQTLTYRTEEVTQTAPGGRVLTRHVDVTEEKTMALLPSGSARIVRKVKYTNDTFGKYSRPVPMPSTTCEVKPDGKVGGRGVPWYFLPGRAVSIGDTWSFSASPHSDFRGFKSSLVALDRKVDGYQCALISTKSSYTDRKRHEVVLVEEKTYFCLSKGFMVRDEMVMRPQERRLPGAASCKGREVTGSRRVTTLTSVR